VERPIALTIAGSDSGGGAGIQADLKTFHAFGAFGTSVVTAVTAQNTLGVRAVHAIPVDIVRAQIAALADDLPPAAFKTGMLATAQVVNVVADAIVSEGFRNFVLDPVMVATSGDRLLDGPGEMAVAERLLPLCTVVTPNLDECSILVGRVVDSPAAMESAARALVGRGARAALVKGGHLSGDTVVDILFDGGEMVRFTRPRLAGRSTHGTGCTLSAGIAAGLAHGRPLRVAVENALAFVHAAIASAPGIGRGSGPLNHFVAVSVD
jgi:hydroxymethylpyrimidine/phosphomethylpyrimidine kinase